MLRELISSAIVAAGCIALYTPVSAQDTAEIAFWQSVHDSGSIAQLKAYIDAYPNGTYRSLADIKISELAGGTPVVQSSSGVDTVDVRTSQAQAECDRLAGHKWDETLPVKPTGFEALKAHAEEAIRACSIAHENSADPRYTFQLARAIWAGGDGPGAVRFYEQATAKGHARATYRLARAYNEALFGLTQDIPKALQLFRKAADLGQAIAAHEAGWILLNGLGDTEIDEASAYRYFQQALADGENKSLYPAGFMYQNGYHVERSTSKAIEYYRRSIESTSFYRNTVRRLLSDILLKEMLTQQLYNPYGNAAPIMEEAFSLLKDRAGANQAAHDEYLERLMRTLSQIGETAAIDAYTNLEATLLIAYWGELLDQFSPWLTAALDERYARFPSSYPAQFPEANAQLTDAYMNAIEEVIYGALAHGLREKYSETNPARECVNFDAQGNSGNLTVQVRNTCDKPVDVAALLLAEQTNGGAKSRREVFEVELQQGALENFVLRTEFGAGATMKWLGEACYADAETFRPSWETGGHFCGYLLPLSNSKVVPLMNHVSDLRDAIISSK